MASHTNKISQKYYGYHHGFPAPCSHNNNDARIEELAKTVKKQAKAIEKLMASDAEKDKRISSLEYQLAVKDKKIHDLEEENMSLVRQLMMYRNSQRDGGAKKPDVIPPGYAYRRPCVVKAHYRSGGLVRRPAKRTYEEYSDSDSGYDSDTGLPFKIRGRCYL